MGRSPGCLKEGLKRGAWTAFEDKTLTEYIKLHGEGKWRSMPQRAGLKRCGKSCRLRWLNYLRPDIKRGNISLEEEDLIIRLHKLLGNRWSLIAGRLPGRTDNEIKNYWNTYLGKKANTSLQTTKINQDEEKNKKINYDSHHVIRTKAIKFSSILFTPQLHQIGPVEDILVNRKQEAKESFVSKSVELSVRREENISPIELMFDATTEDVFLSDFINYDFSEFLDFNNSNFNDNFIQLSPSDGFLTFSSDLIDNWIDCLHQDIASSSYEDFANLINTSEE